jgi:hypothetical protein
MAAPQARARRSTIHAANAGALTAVIQPAPIVQKSAPAPIDMPVAVMAAAPAPRTARPARTLRSTPQVLMAAAIDAENRGDPAMAVRILRRVCLVAPRSAAAHNKLAVLLATKLRKFSEACDAAIRAVELEPENVSYKSNMTMMKILANVDDNDPRTKGEDGHGLSRSLKRTAHDSLRSFFLASWSLILSMVDAAIALFSRSASPRPAVLIQRPIANPMQAGIAIARTPTATMHAAATTPTNSPSTIGSPTLRPTSRIQRRPHAAPAGG